jgi:histone H3/H4
MAKKAAKKTAAPKAAKSKGEMLLVVSKVKGALRDHGMNVASDAPDALNKVVYDLVSRAAKLAQANGRKTIRPYDFTV